jgi:hypothetical protein
MPDLMDKVNNIMNKMLQDKKEEKNKVRQEEIRQRKEEAKEKNEQNQEKVLKKTRPQRNVANPNIMYEYEYDEQPNIEQVVDVEEYDE